MPQWSPNGRLFATTRDEKVMLIEPSSASPITITLSDVSAVVLPSNAWSYDSAFVVGVDFIQESTHLINVAQAQAITVALDIDRAAPIRWNPVRPELLITARGENRRPELRIITPDGQHRAFAPQDNQAARVFGEWSPDGSQIAYVAGARADNLAGTLWVANADGGNVRQIVADGLNSAPVWSPMGNAIFFTRIVTSTSNSSNFTYDLYRVRPDGQEMTRIGAGIPPQSFANQDRRALIDWSPDGQFMFFQSGDAPGQRTISLARPDGANAQILDVDLFDINFARWSPTSRALLLAGDAEAILYWLDRKQSQSFPAGVSYAWQP
jgi:dipeptidyl aminopeptidase/acylaminoacyl peptidase